MNHLSGKLCPKRIAALCSLLFLSPGNLLAQSPFKGIDDWYESEMEKLQSHKDKSEEEMFIEGRKALLTELVKEERRIEAEYLKKANAVKLSRSGEDRDLELCAQSVKEFKRKFAEIKALKGLADIDETQLSTQQRRNNPNKAHEGYFKQKLLRALKDHLSVLWPQRGRSPYKEAVAEILGTLPDAGRVFNDKRAFTEEAVTTLVTSVDKAPGSICLPVSAEVSFSRMILGIAERVTQESEATRPRYLANQVLKGLGYVHLPVSGNQYLCWMRAAFYTIFEKSLQDPDALKAKLDLLASQSTSGSVQRAVAKLTAGYPHPDSMLKVVLRSKNHLMKEGRYPEVLEEILRLISQEILSPSQYALKVKEAYKALYHPTTAGDASQMQLLTNYFFNFKDEKARLDFRSTVEVDDLAPSITRPIRNPQGEEVDFGGFMVPMDFGTVVLHLKLGEHNKAKMPVLVDSQGRHFELDILKERDNGDEISLNEQPYATLFARDEELAALALEKVKKIETNNYDFSEPVVVVKAVERTIPIPLQRELDRIIGFGTYVNKLAQMKTLQEIEDLLADEGLKTKLINSVMGRKYHNLLLAFANQSKQRIGEGQLPDRLEKGRIDGYVGTLRRVFKAGSPEEITAIVEGEKESLINAKMGRKYYNALKEKAEQRTKELRGL